MAKNAWPFALETFAKNQRDVIEPTVISYNSLISTLAMRFLRQTWGCSWLNHSLMGEGIYVAMEVEVHTYSHLVKC